MKKNLKVITYVLLDILAVGIAWVLGTYLCEVLNSSETLGQYIINYYYYFLGGMAIALISNLVFGLYSRLWRYADISDVIRVIFAGFIECIYLLIISVLGPFSGSFAILTSCLYLILLAGVRIAQRLVIYLRNSSKILQSEKFKKIIVIGAGAAGSVLIKEMKSTNKAYLVPVCVLDDDESKIGTVINGVKVVGKINEITFYAKKYNADEVLIAIPSLNRQALKGILEICKETGLKIKTVPGMYQLADGEVTIESVKDVSILDLLGREQVKVNLEEIMGYIENKVVMVTGGGGSIGSELCRQIASHNPKKLIILDIYENNAYDIQQELLRKYPGINLLVLIASVRDSNKIDKVFEKYQPDIVFHAAAHKHVPLMETSPNEAVKNNVKGTYNVADSAGKYGTKRFIMISTDKAVNPTNIMGATKRICEMIIQQMNKKYQGTEYVAVRFGNVLGSNGSVIPLFAKQIAEGGPVTVTHKDIVRYFMTIPEAVSLVLQAGSYAKGGEIFVLDMGEPVKIYDLALNMIKLSGLVPFKDIDIKITGLRPGEKLYEERLMKEEGLQRTPNNLISIGKPLEIDEEHFFEKVLALYDSARKETKYMKKLVKELVPTYIIDDRE